VSGTKTLFLVSENYENTFSVGKAANISQAIFGGGYGWRYPYFVLIKLDDGSLRFCGGVLVSDMVVLSTASCTPGLVVVLLNQYKTRIFLFYLKKKGNLNFIKSRFLEYVMYFTVRRRQKQLFTAEKSAKLTQRTYISTQVLTVAATRTTLVSLFSPFRFQFHVIVVFV